MLQNLNLQSLLIVMQIWYLENICLVHYLLTEQQLPSSPTRFGDRNCPTIAVRQTAADRVFDYASAVLKDCLLLFELKDA